MAIYLGNRRWVVSVDDEPELPDVHRLKISASPNPFNSAITISFSLPHNGNARIDIFNVQGHIVGEYDLGLKSVGEHSVYWNAEGYANGIYFTRVHLEGKNSRHAAFLKLLLLK